jgi:peptide/nickel transport system substrate-binding protein
MLTRPMDADFFTHQPANLDLSPLDRGRSLAAYARAARRGVRSEGGDRMRLNRWSLNRLRGAATMAAAMWTAVTLSSGDALAQPKGVFRQAHEIGFGDASSLDPASRGRVFQITEKIMSRLVRPGLDGKPAADLASSWSANATATEWTFKLRPNVKFHDGRALTAEDVVYTLRRIQDPKTDSPVRPSIAMISDMAAVDPLTVRMTLSQPFADLPLQLTDYRLMIIPKDSGDTIKTTGIGTGPFKVERFDPRGTTVLVANAEYFEGAPGVERMEIIGIADAQARLQALLGGQIDFLPGMTRQQRTLVERSNRHKVQRVDTGNWRGIVFKADSKPFDDVRVRKAMRLAVDRKAMLELAAGADGGVIGCDSPVAPKDQYRATLACAQDIAGAKALLAQAGFANGIDIEVHTSTVESVWPTIAEAFQQQVAAAGIRVKITAVPTDGYWNQVWRKRDVVMTRWNERPADGLLNEIYRGGATWNESFFNDPKFDALLDEARRELDFDKRKALYIRAQEHLWENGSTLVAYHVTDNVGLTARARDVDAVENFSIRWHRVKVD